MKILWLAHMLPYPPIEGSLLRTFHLLEQASRFADVEVLAFVQQAHLALGGSVDDSVRELERVCKVRGTFAIACDGPLAKLALAATCLATGRSYTSSWTRSAAYRNAVAGIVRDRPDVIVLDTIGLAGNLPGGALPVPLVLNHHNEEVSMLARRAEAQESRLKAAYFRLEGRKLAAECERFFPRVSVHMATSELDRDRLREVGDPALRCAIVANGVDTQRYPRVFDAGPKETFDLLFVGGGAWYPNRDAVDWLIAEIWPRARARIPSSRLVLVGRAPSRAAIDAAQSDPRVIVTGFVEDLRPWAAAAGVFICPIRDGGGTRLKILHALSYGLPIVSTSIGVEGIALRDGEHYLRADDAEALAARVVAVSNDSGLAERLSRAGRELVVEKYDWRSIGKALEVALRDAIACNRDQ